MKYLLFALLAGWTTTASIWYTDIKAAQKMAQEGHRLVLLNFSGSDWCGPCMRLRKEVFDGTAFTGFADSNLVLLNADFPRNKKNQLPKELQKHNDALAEQYNPEGKFPFTLLLSAEGKVLGSWEGFPANSEQFLQSLRTTVHANHR